MGEGQRSAGRQPRDDHGSHAVGQAQAHACGRANARALRLASSRVRGGSSSRETARGAGRRRDPARFCSNALICRDRLAWLCAHNRAG